MMNEMEHSGIKGMHWYQRRFQNEDGSLTTEGRLRYGVGEARKAGSTKKKVPTSNPKQTVHNAKEAKKVLDERKKQEEAKKAEEQRHKDKAAAINSGKASTVAKYRDIMTTQELKNAIDRINTEQSLDKLLASEAQRSRGKSFIEKFKDGGEKVSTVFSTVNDAMNKYNNVRETIDKTMGYQQEKEKQAAERERKSAVEKAVRSGDATAISKILSRMTDNEIENASKRLSNIDKINQRVKKTK